MNNDSREGDVRIIKDPYIILPYVSSRCLHGTAMIK